MGQRVCLLTRLSVTLLTRSRTIHVARESLSSLVSTVVDHGDSSFLETRKYQESKLERFFKPDPISFCHFSFRDVIWTPHPKHSCLKKKQEKSRYDRLFELVVSVIDSHPDRGGGALDFDLSLLVRIVRILGIQRSVHRSVQPTFVRQPGKDDPQAY